MDDQQVTPKYSRDEFARRGQAILEESVLPRIAETSRGKVVAVDIESGEFKIAGDTLQAALALRSRLPTAQIWCARIGYPAVHRTGRYCPE